MEEDEVPRGGYKEALLSAAGKRQRSKAHTGLTPPALQQWTKEADAASTTPRDAINTNVLQEPYVEHQAEGTSCGFRSNLNANDNNDSHSHQQPGAQPDDSQPPHPELVELHQCKASIITMNAMRLEPLKRMRVSMRNSILPKQTPVRRYQEIRGNQLRRQGQVREQLHGLDISGRRRLRQLECVKKQSINTDLTTREMLVLAEARCHYVALKLEAQDTQGSQSKLRRTLRKIRSCSRMSPCLHRKSSGQRHSKRP